MIKISIDKSMVKSSEIINILEHFSEFAKISMVFEFGKIHSIFIENIDSSRDEKAIARELERELIDLKSQLKIQEKTTDIVGKIIDKVFTKHV